MNQFCVEIRPYYEYLSEKRPQMKILLTMRKVWEELRNPIALLDLAAYWRGLGHQVDVFFFHQLLEEGKGSANYDLVGLSVLQALDESVPLRDAVELKKKYQT